ncbi:hypothetical protein [Paracoccus sp. (in: a-proteobacteria)]|uniref:hypothetical protein n=1 Tax=Paracoccus sp. TaxID=267 RepID=UPI0028A1F93E|nr:hypothetical protein [Paracoccus sp. (in: a-proteobacteria)]
MASIRGEVVLKAGGKNYRLFLGMSVLADLQDQHGADFLERLEPPEGAPPNWMPPLKIVQDTFLGALQRYHPDEADRWLVDDLIAGNEGAFNLLMNGSSPDVEAVPAGKATAPKKRR